MSTVSVAVGGVPRVNLMPRSEIARRERETLVRRWLWGVLAAIVVALLIIGGAVFVKWAADQRLTAEQAESSRLLSELAALAEVSQALATERELTAFRAESMGADFAWAPVFASVEGSLPSDAQMVGFDLIGGGIPQGADPTLEAGLVGTIVVGSRNPVDIVAVARELRTVPGVILADAVSVTESSVAPGSFVYELTVVYDQSIYSGKYAPAEVSE
ncbi:MULTISPECIES: hypothetical protein [Microbacterium]|uniref:hypothetical protein n=1 Tax=Microbacterium TaxID=33882 RepID=UPI00146CEAAF|nr:MULTISPECIES: hypothetical protein [Microbacterium]